MTPAVVGVLQRNDSVKSIYVNADGYPEHMQPTLEALVEEGTMNRVINEGDASCLYSTLAQCVFYCRDKHEEFEDVEPQTWQSIEEFEDGADAPHIYLVELDPGRGDRVGLVSELGVE